jgi:NAD(P)-dependent dehydrogenase (short-subunit alcohol dehydrogenase family)
VFRLRVLTPFGVQHSILTPVRRQNLERVSALTIRGLESALGADWGSKATPVHMQERRALVAEQSDEIFDAVFNVNVRAVFQAMKAEIAAMLQSGGGVIVNNASVSGLRNPNPGLTNP